MKLLLIILTLAQLSSAKLLIIKNLNRLQSIINDIARQQNLTGFTVTSWNYGKRRSELKQISDGILKSLAKSRTVTSINSRFRISKFRITRPVLHLSNGKYYRVPGAVPHVLADRNCLPVILACVNVNTYDIFPPFDLLADLNLPQRTSSKVLYVLIHRHQGNKLKPFLKVLVNSLKFDIEIIFISMQRKKRSQLINN